MATTNLALVGADSGSAALVTYVRRACEGYDVQYVGTNTNDSLAAPRIIDVKLSIKEPGAIGNDRISASLKRTVLNADTSLPSTGSVTVTISIPRDAAWTANHTISLLKQAADYLGGASATVSGQTDTTGFPALWAQGLIP